MKVVRVLVYEMDEEDMESQLGGSLPEGQKMWEERKTITVYTLPNSWRCLRLLKFWWGLV